jgi:peroxiredoxin
MSRKLRSLGVPATLIALLCLAGLVALHASGPDKEPADKSDPGRTVPAFRLQDTDGKDVALADFRDKKAVVVVFTGTQCPLAQFYALELAELQREYGPRGAQILAIYSNAQDAPEAVKKHARDRQLPYPALLDPGQKVADLFGAERTPEAFILDAGGAVRYRGRIDDRYTVGGDRGEATRRDLMEALREVLAGRAVSVPWTPVAGCFIGRAKGQAPPAPVTYARHVAPILQRSCVECHRPGQIGPFALETYEDARDWSDTIAEVVAAGRMPPWHADPRFGEFANDRSLPEADRKTLLAWVAQGCPRGDDKDLPAPRVFPQGWGIGEPDRVLTMKEAFAVPAVAPKGGIPYQHFVLDTNLPEDVWVKAVEARPGNRAVVHHMLVYIGDAPAESGGETADRDTLVGYVPGSKPTFYPDGLSKRIPSGSKLVLEMHYTANGTAQSDRSSVALVFTRQPPRHEVRSRFVLNSKFAIPPGAASHEVTATTTFDKPAVLLSLTPHMHLRGKDFLFRAVYPDGRAEVLLSVPRYDFNWQHTYGLKKPLAVPAGTRIECVAHFDNSRGNPNNPDPLQLVRWGDQSWEEMMLGVVGYFWTEEPKDNPS